MVLRHNSKYTLCAVIALLCLVAFGYATDAKLPAGYNSVMLGMTVDEAKDTLSHEPMFGYRGDRDVSLLSGDNRTLITTRGTSFLGECWFQFDKNRLYVITLNLDHEKIDYYSVFSTLCKKYGQPDSLSPSKSEWNDGSVIMVLEKPLVLKYMDVTILNELQDSSSVQLSVEEYTRQMFLDSL